MSAVTHSRQSRVVGLFQTVLAVGGFLIVMLFGSWVHWYSQLVTLDRNVACTIELEKQEARRDFYNVMLQMGDQSLVLSYIEQAQRPPLFQGGSCHLKTWSKGLNPFNPMVQVVDSSGREWLMQATGQSTYDPRKPWSIWWVFPGYEG